MPAGFYHFYSGVPFLFFKESGIMKFCKILLCSLMALCFASCVSSPQKNNVGKDVAENDSPENWMAIDSIKDLNGIWVSGECSYVYPFLYGNKRYLKVTAAWTDDTFLWEGFSKILGLSLEELWEKRFAYLERIYGLDRMFLSDEYGSEMGKKLERTFDGKIRSQNQWLVAEKILIENKDFFLMNKDGTKLIGNRKSPFNMFSHLGEIYSDGSIYERMQNVW